MCDISHNQNVSKTLGVLKTEEFENWLRHQQPKIRTIILARLDLVSIGHLFLEKFQEEFSVLFVAKRFWNSGGNKAIISSIILQNLFKYGCFLIYVDKTYVLRQSVLGEGNRASHQ